MERNWDTVREILLETELLKPTQTLTLDDFDEKRAYEISYHVELMADAGILQANISKTLSQNPSQFFVRSLSWQGHEFLDSIREVSIWERTKSTIYEKGGVMTFGLIQDVAISITRKTLGI